MYFRKIILLVVVFVLGFVNTQTVFAAVNSGNDKPIERAKWMVFDETRSIVFVLNDDSSLSGYDLVNNKFNIVRKALPGVEGAYTFLINSEGSHVAVFSAMKQTTKVTFFRIDDIFGQETPEATATYTTSVPTQGRVFGSFSSDGKVLFLADGTEIIRFLDVEGQRSSIRSGEDVSINTMILGQVSTKMTLDKSGRLLVLSEFSETLSIIDTRQKKVLASIKLGTAPKDILYNQANNNVYVSHTGSDEIYVIDAETMAVVEKIKVGNDPVAMAFDRDTGDVFVANNSSGTISRITSDFQMKTIDLHSPAYYESSPLSLFYLNAEKKLFIINSSTAKLFVYDVATDRVVKEEKTSFFPITIFGSEKLRTIFVRHINANFIWQVDGSTLDAWRIPDADDANTLFFSKPQGIAVDSESNKIYVSNVGDNTITVIDGETQKPITKITVSNSPQTIGFQSVTKKLYGVSPVDNTVIVVDTTKEAYPVKTIHTEKQPRSLNFNTVTNRVYVSNATDSSITVIDGASDEVVSTISLSAGMFPLVLSVNSELNKVYSAAYGGDSIFVINAETNTMEKQIIVGQNPIWVRYVPELKRVLVTVEGEKKIVIINPENNEIVQTINTETAGKPYRIFFDPRTDYIYINFRNSEKMVVLARDENTSSFRIIREAVIPFFGETDARPYNMVATNEKTKLNYFTSGNNNNVVIVRDELDKEGVRDPVWYATINADGSVVYSQDAKEEIQTQENKEPPFITLPNLIKLLVLGIIAIIGIGIAIFIRRKSERNSISSSP